jgi:transposase
MNIVLTSSQREEIKQLHRFCKQRRFADRLKALLLLDKGFSCVEVGHILLLDDDTVRGYANQYLNQGAQSLLSDNNKGTSPFLKLGQLELLDLHLSDNVYSDSKGIIAWVFNEFGITYTTSGINALLKRMGFVYKKPVLTPCKVDEKKQQEFVTQYQQVKQNLAKEDQIYFVDGVHPQHNTIANYGWIKKGHTKQLKTNNGRQRININGAYNAETKQVFYVEDERINAQTMIALLQLILKEQKEGKIHIVLDNARYYHALVVKEFLEGNTRIILHFLPPYSPNLNIIERLWKILKTKVVYNKFYLKFNDFKFAVNLFFKNEIWKQKEFENSLIDKFQIIKPDFSGSYL